MSYGRNDADLGEPQITGPVLRSLRERAGLERSAVAAVMGVGRQRIVNIEALALPARDAMRRYLEAIEQLSSGFADPPSG